MVRAADRAVEIGASTVQLFSDNPTAYRRRAEPSPELGAFRARLSAGGIEPVAIHGSYLTNPAAADDVLHARSVELLTSELIAAQAHGAHYVNIHIGSHGGAGVAAGIARVVAAIGQSLAAADADVPALAPMGHGGGGPVRPVITLENGSGSGWGLGIDVDELVAIAVALDEAGVPRDRVAFCLDTAHAWGAGYDLSHPAAIDELLTDIDRRLGIDRLPLVHLNDSRSERGSRLDRHEHIGAGRIGQTGMGHLLRHPLLAGSAYILETPGMDVGYDAINLERARSLARGERLEPLPPEAFTLKGSRARAATPTPSPSPTPSPANQARRPVPSETR